MRLSIGVTSYKNTELLRLCLEIIIKETADIECEVIHAGSAVEETTEMMLREEFPNVRSFEYRQNVGFRALVNRLIQESTGDYLLILNHDIVITPGAVQEMLVYLRAHPGVGAIGPQQRYFNGEKQFTCFRFYKPVTILFRRTFLKHLPAGKRHLDWFLMKDKNLNKVQSVDWVLGSAVMVSREAVEKVGSMDERFFMYMEDVDWCRRFWGKGYKVVYYPKVELYHLYGKGSAKGGFFRSLLFNRLTWAHISSAIKYFYKYAGKPSPRSEE